jgi:hypothetical protein
VLTVNGRIALARKRYFAKAVGSHAPPDGWLDHAGASIGRGVKGVACRLNQASRSFAKAADNLARRAQLRLSRETSRDLAEAEGKAARATGQAGRLPPGWDAGACFVPDEGGRPTARARLHVGAGGFMVPVVTQAEEGARRRGVKARRRRRGRRCRPLPRARKGAEGPFKEFRVITHYGEPVAHRLASVTRGNSARVGRQLRRDACRVRLSLAQDEVAVVDGAEWIRRQLRQQGLPLDAVVLDFYHLAENVRQARRAVYGEADPTGEADPGNRFAARVLHAAKHEGLDGPDRELCSWLKALRGPTKRKAALRLPRHVSEREEMVAYPEFVGLGRQIGSGPTESMCKAAALRVKGVGKKWDADNAEAVLTPEALDQSGLRDQYWNLGPLLAL